MENQKKYRVFSSENIKAADGSRNFLNSQLHSPLITLKVFVVLSIYRKNINKMLGWLAMTHQLLPKATRNRKKGVSHLH